MQDEYLDLVDENDVVMGKKLRSEVYAENLSNFRVVNAFIVNSKGEIWVPRRGPTKRIFPLCLDMSMGGHVESGETYDEAFKRETSEEINIDVDQVGYKCIGHLSPQVNGTSANMNVYEINLEDVSDYNKDDFIEHFWLKPEDVLKKIESGDKSKSDLPILVRYYMEVKKIA
jgi:isopentenyl-diphosphate delta-isomerase